MCLFEEPLGTLGTPGPPVVAMIGFHNSQENRLVLLRVGVAQRAENCARNRKHLGGARVSVCLCRVCVCLSRAFLCNG